MYSKFFNFYLGTDIAEDEKNQVTTDCPFCGKTDHFFINPVTSLWDCKVCGEEGNQLSLITKLWEQAVEDTQEDDLQTVSLARGIKVSVLKRAGVAYSGSRDVWYVPYRSPTNKCLTNLGVFDVTRKKGPYTIYKGATLSLGLYNPFNTSLSGKIFVCEGEWDAMALQQILNDPKARIVAVPGAQTFKKEYLAQFKDVETVHLLYDNDGPGMKGSMKAQEILAGAGTHTLHLDWSMIPEAPKDIRDMLTKHGSVESKSLIIPALVKSETTATVEENRSAGYFVNLKDIEEIDTFEEYLDVFREHIYINEAAELSIALCMAIAVSIKIPGEMLWAFLISPPSGGKSTLIESYGGSNMYYEFMSKLSATSMVSGWRDASGEESSFLPTLNGKTLFIKDFTTVLSMSPAEQRPLFGLLRDLYDGTFKFRFGNNKLCEFHNLNFNMIAGVTDAIRGHNDAELGERFLRIDMLGKDYDEDVYTEMALRNFGKRNSRKDALARATLGFTKKLMSIERELPDVDPYYDSLLSSYGQLIAKVRTKPVTDRFEGLVYKPRPELPIRVALQLKKLLIGLSWVYNESTPAEKSIAAINKTVVDTCDGFVFDTLKTISMKAGITRSEIREKISIDETRMHRIIKDLETLKFIERSKAHRTIGKGRDAHIYEALPKIRTAIKSLV